MQGETFWKKFPPAPPSKTFSQKSQKGNPKSRTDGRRERTLALALANSQAPPRPCSLRELICFGAGRRGRRPLQGKSKFCSGRRPRRPANKRVL